MSWIFNSSPRSNFMYFPALGLLCVMSCSGNSSHRNGLTFRTLCRNVTSDEFLRKKINLNCLQCTSLNLVYFKESFPYGVPCFLLMQKTSFHVAKGHVLQRESMPFVLLKDVFCVAGLMLLPEPLWRHGHDNTIRHTIQRFFRQTGVSFCGLSERRARCA